MKIVESLFLKMFRIFYRATNSFFTKDKVHCQINRWINVDLHTEKWQKRCRISFKKFSDVSLLDVTWVIVFISESSGVRVGYSAHSIFESSSYVLDFNKSFFNEFVSDSKALFLCEAGWNIISLLFYIFSFWSLNTWFSFGI